MAKAQFMSRHGDEVLQTDVICTTAALWIRRPEYGDKDWSVAFYGKKVRRVIALRLPPLPPFGKHIDPAGPRTSPLGSNGTIVTDDDGNGII